MHVFVYFIVYTRHVIHSRNRLERISSVRLLVFSDIIENYRKFDSTFDQFLLIVSTDLIFSVKLVSNLAPENGQLFSKRTRNSLERPIIFALKF